MMDCHRSAEDRASYGNPASSVASTPMQRLAEKLLTAFQLTRLSLVFGAIADVWFIVIYTRSDTRYDLLPAFEMPLAIDLVTAALLAVGLFAFATSLNDLLDLRHDAAFSPSRPLPAGRIRAGQAVARAERSAQSAGRFAVLAPVGRPNFFLLPTAIIGVIAKSK